MNNNNNNNHNKINNHNLSTIGIIGFVALSILYVESKSQTPEEKQKLYFISNIIITAALISRFIIEDVISRPSKEKQQQEQGYPQIILNLRNPISPEIDPSIDLNKKNV